MRKLVLVYCPDVYGSDLFDFESGRAVLFMKHNSLSQYVEISN